MGTGKTPNGTRRRTVWEPEYKPKNASDYDIFVQKLEYIHHNPVRSGFVLGAEDWFYSSAPNYHGRPMFAMEVDLYHSADPPLQFRVIPRCE
ncbi:MAG: hypothetical protein ACR2IE_11875 [Candidatus Sumerlaeaceae bacterium]